jgi:hypothetical protein
MIEVQRVKDKNKEVRDEINKEITEMMQRKKEEDAVEQRKKEELIRQIRELEKIPIVRTKGFDPTETGGHGLLEEMSVAELRERLEFNRRQDMIDTNMKREENLKNKEEFVSKLMDESDKIQKDREQRKRFNDNRRLQKQMQEEEKARKMQEMREKGYREAHAKISHKKKTKKEEEEQLAKELKEIRLQRQYLNANRAMVEAKAYEELEKGAERMIRTE